MSRFTGLKAFVVDDTTSILALFAALLEANGAQVFSAASGHDFLNSVEAASPDMILLDIQMPEMDGFEVIAKLQQLESIRDIPVIALTAHAMAGDRERIMEKGFSGYIAKPVDTRLFPDQVASIIQL